MAQENVVATTGDPGVKLEAWRARARARDKLKSRRKEGVPVRESLLDTSKLRLFQKAIREDEARYALVADVLAEGVYEWNVTEDRLYTSSRLRELLEVGARQISPLEWGERLHPEDVECYFETLAAHFRGESVRFECEYRLLCGENYRWVVDRGRAVNDDGDRPTKLVGSIRDITAQRHAEAALRESERRYALAIQAIDVGVFDWNIDTGETYCSPLLETAFGVNDNERRVPDRLDNLIHPDDRGGYYAALAAHLAGESERFEYEFRFGEGNRWARMQAMALRHQDGRAYRIVGSTRDVTLLKRWETELSEAREQALRANQAKSEFLASMSHELRTPLNVIIGIAELMMEDDETQADEPGEPLNRIHRAGKQLLSLINEILDLSKIEAGKMSLNLETFNLQSVLEDVLTTIEPLAAKSGNSVSVDLPSHACWLLADEGRVRQVILNLVSNACKFSELSTISVRLEEGPTCYSIEVSDSGIGMTQEQQQKLFKPFSQGDQSISHKYGGTGLGLAISQRFCQMLGGKITVQSELGKGSTFRVSLPRGAEDRGLSAPALREQRTTSVTA